MNGLAANPKRALSMQQRSQGAPRGMSCLVRSLGYARWLPRDGDCMAMAVAQDYVDTDTHADSDTLE